MATLFLKTAGGNSNAAGTWSNVSSAGVDNSGPPTAATDCIADSLSGNLTINAALACRSFDESSANVAAVGTYAGAITHNAGVTWTIGDATAGAGNIALRLVVGATYTSNNNTTSKIVFASTSATQQSITTAAGKPGNTDFNGVGGSWRLLDAFSTRSASASIMDILAGTVNFNAQTVTVGVLKRSSSAAVAVLTTGGGFTNVANTGTAVDFSVGSTNFTLNAANCVLGMNGNSSTFEGGGLSWGTIVWTSVGAPHVLNGANTFSTDIQWAPSAAQTNIMTIGANQTVNGRFNIQGNSPANRCLVQSSVEGTARTITAALTTLVDVDFEDITGAGAASSFTGTRLGDWGGNSGITMTAAANKFLVSGNANTTYATSNHFATTSGGAVNVNNYPLPQDTLIIDTNTGWTTGPRTLTTTAAQRHPALDNSAMTQNQTITLWTNRKSIKLASAKTTTLTVITTKPRAAGDCQFTTGGAGGWTGGTVNLRSPVAAGSVVMQDSIVAGLATAVVIDLGTATLGGTFNGNSLNHSIVTVQGGGLAGLTWGTGNWTITTSWVPTAGVTYSGASGTLTIGGTATPLQAPENWSIGTLAIATGATPLVLQSNVGAAKTLTAGTVTIAKPRTLTFNIGTDAVTIAFTTMVALGSSGNLITVATNAAGTAVTMFTHTSPGTVCVDWWSIKDSTVSGGAAFFAGVNSTNVSGNTGWTFAACPSSYVQTMVF